MNAFTWHVPPPGILSHSVTDCLQEHSVDGGRLPSWQLWAISQFLIVTKAAQAYVIMGTLPLPMTLLIMVMDAADPAARVAPKTG